MTLRKMSHDDLHHGCSGNGDDRMPEAFFPSSDWYHIGDRKKIDHNGNKVHNLRRGMKERSVPPHVWMQDDGVAPQPTMRPRTDPPRPNQAGRIHTQKKRETKHSAPEKQDVDESLSFFCMGTKLMISLKEQATKACSTV